MGALVLLDGFDGGNTARARITCDENPLKNLLNSACLLKRRFIVIELQLLSENLIVFCSENVFIEKVHLKLRVKFFSLSVSSGITGKT